MRSLEVVVPDAVDDLHACHATHEQDAWRLGLSVNGEGDPGIRSEAPHFRRVVRTAHHELPPFPHIAGRDHLRRTAYLRWVTIGELIASMGSSETLLASIPSNRRRPVPSRTGDSAIANSSTSPALRYWMTTSAPPAIRISLSPAWLRARKSARSIPSLTKWNVVPPGRSHGLRTCFVSTNTGVWKGASSGQACSPPSNMRFPIMLTPVRL